jgi:uncharacterized protein (TIGR02118 family)
MVFIKRKPGMSMEDFVSYYENNHAPLGARIVGNLKKYTRNYITPYGNDVYAKADELPYDVVTEIWFEDRAEFERGMANLTEPRAAATIAEDEENLFDRSSIRFVIADEWETRL